MSSWALRTLRRVGSDLITFQDGRRIPLDVVDAFVLGLQLVYRELIALEHLTGFDSDVEHACEVVRTPLLSKSVPPLKKCTPSRKVYPLSKSVPPLKKCSYPLFAKTPCSS